MELKDIVKFELKRANPFPGLMIDADAWRDAHDYHRNQQRLHVLAFHRKGIIGGLEVTASAPQDLSVTIHPGLGIDPDGNAIVITQPQRYAFQTREKGVVHLVLQYREVPSGPYQPPEGGLPSRLIDAYRIQERTKLPTEPFIELARIDFDPSDGVVRDAKDQSKPGKNEIDLRFRPVMQELPEAKGPPVAAPVRIPEPIVVEKPPEPKIAPVEPVIQPERTAADVVEIPSEEVHTLVVGHVVLGESRKDMHCDGLRNLAKIIDRQYDFLLEVMENISLDSEIARCNLLYMTGSGRFELTPQEQSVLGSFLESGGAVLGEGCSEGSSEGQSKGAKEFGLAFNQLAAQLKCRLEIVRRGHPILNNVNIFSAIPQGAATGMLLEGGHMIYSGGDYGCAWEGGHRDNPLPREIIRSSMEIGVNIVDFAGG